MVMISLTSGLFALTIILGPSLVNAQTSVITLETFLETAQKESPDLAIENANVDAANARATGVRLDPPMVGLMQMKEGTGKQDGYEISQSVPFPTKMIQDKKVRDLELETQKESSRYQKVLILNDARNSYINFWSAFERLQILKDKYHWLDHHVAITRSTTRSDSAAQVHLLEVESDRDLIENDVLAMEAEFAEKRNALKIYAPSLDVERTTPKEPALPLVEVGNSKPSFIQLKEKELATFEAQEGLKKQSYLPDLFFRLRAFNGNEVNPQSQEIMVGISLPFLYFWQPKSQIAEASAQRMKAQAELQKSKIEFETRLSTLSKKLESLKTQLGNLKEKLIPRAERRKKLALNISTRTMEGLDQHKSVEIGLLDLRMKAIDLRIDYENSFREILKLTGGSSQAGVR